MRFVRVHRPRDVPNSPSACVSNGVDGTTHVSCNDFRVTRPRDIAASGPERRLPSRQRRGSCLAAKRRDVESPTRHEPKRTRRRRGDGRNTRHETSGLDARHGVRGHCSRSLGGPRAAEAGEEELEKRRRTRSTAARGETTGTERSR